MMRATHAGPRDPGPRGRAPWLGLVLALTSACATFGRGAPSGAAGGTGLEEITPANVAGLRPVCTFDPGDAETSRTAVTVMNGVVYLSTDTATFAIQGATCALLWKHEHASRPRSLSGCDQGVAQRDGRIYRTFGDGHVVAIDGASGRTLWDVAVAPALADGTTSSPMIAGVSATATGLVFTDLDGILRAFEAANGNERWRAQGGELGGGGVVAFAADGRHLVVVSRGSVSGAPVQGGRSRLVVLGVQGQAGPERRRPVYID